MIAGVCGGIGEYFNIDPVIVRLIFIALILVSFSSVIFYIVAWFIVPVNPEQ
jgi:phage shock protein C